MMNLFTERTIESFLRSHGFNLYGDNYGKIIFPIMDMVTREPTGLYISYFTKESESKVDERGRPVSWKYGIEIDPTQPPAKIEALIKTGAEIFRKDLEEVA